MNEPRWTELQGAEIRYFALSEELTAETDPITREFFEYYRTSRAANSRATTLMSARGDKSFFHMRPFNHVDAITPGPVLLVAGENADSLFLSEQAYGRASDPREQLFVPGAGQLDLYDRMDLIPFAKLQDFCNTHVLPLRNLLM